MAEGFDDAGGSARFAKKVGIGSTAYSNYENGVRLSRDAAEKIANKVPGLTTDYLIRANENGLSVDLLRRIEVAKEQDEQEQAEDAKTAPAMRKGDRA